MGSRKRRLPLNLPLKLIMFPVSAAREYWTPYLAECEGQHSVVSAPRLTAVDTFC
jgi:hypothetical protein